METADCTGLFLRYRKVYLEDFPMQASAATAPAPARGGSLAFFVAAANGGLFLSLGSRLVWVSAMEYNEKGNPFGALKDGLQINRDKDRVPNR
ncbi:MAG: hypothetical protein HPY50_15550 [Firmicutes bacterium]|nr:hypothetical protein [Bacillota bacterium]